MRLLHLKDFQKAFQGEKVDRKIGDYSHVRVDFHAATTIEKCNLLHIAASYI